MRTVLYFLAVVLCLGTHVGSAETPSCPPAAVQKPDQARLNSAAKNAKDHGFLWRVTKGEQVSYLYGTIHLATFEGMFPGPLTRKALLQADTIALELDMADPSIMKRLMQSASTTKSHNIPEALVNRIKQAAKAQCFPYENIATMMPEMQVMTLGLLESRQDGLYVDYGIDMVLAGFGHAMKKNMISLESPEMQMEMFRMLSQPETIELVEKSLYQLKTGEARELTLRMYKSWESSNYQDLEHYTDWCQCVDTVSDKKFMERLLDQRNIKLAEKIDQLHASGKSVFVAVGSLHMFGEKSLPRLMGERGYQVEAVRF